MQVSKTLDDVAHENPENLKLLVEKDGFMAEKYLVRPIWKFSQKKLYPYFDYSCNVNIYREQLQELTRCLVNP